MAQDGGGLVGPRLGAKNTHFVQQLTPPLSYCTTSCATAEVGGSTVARNAGLAQTLVRVRKTVFGVRPSVRVPKRLNFRTPVRLRTCSGRFGGGLRSGFACLGSVPDFVCRFGIRLDVVRVRVLGLVHELGFVRCFVRAMAQD